MSSDAAQASSKRAKAQFAAHAPYVAEHRADYAGRWIEWDGDTAIPVVAFAANLDAHRAAIDAEVRVDRVPQARVALESLEQPAMAFVDAAEGVEMSTAGIEIRRGCVLLEVIAESPQAGAAFQTDLAERFGTLVQADVVADELFSERVTGFEAWHTDQGGRTLTVHWWGGGDGEDYVLEIYERADVVRAQVRGRYTNHLVGAAGSLLRVSAPLAQPLDGRAVIDATTNERRPHGHKPPPR